MGLKVFIDVNIIIDFALQRTEGYTEARKLLEAIVEKKVVGCTSPIVIHIASHILKK